MQKCWAVHTVLLAGSLVAGALFGVFVRPALAQAKPEAVEWTGSFNGITLDETKWERFTFEGGNGGTFRIKDDHLYMRGVPGSRSGVRSRQKFSADRFIAEANLARVGAALPEPERAGLQPGYAVLTILFDDSGRNRLEWILTSEGMFEAWSTLNGRSSRLDNHKLGTKAVNPTIGIVRRDDQIMFMLNGEVGMQQTIKDLPREFWLMLYGYGTSENSWSSARVVTVRQP